MTTTTIYTREQAKSADKELYEAMLVVSDKQARLTSALNSIHRAADDDYRRRYDSRSGWMLSDQEAIDKANQIAASDTTYIGRQAQDALDRGQQAGTELDQAKAAKALADKWEDNGRWPRYAVVPGGHIHKQMGCFTLRWDTDVRWAYQVSGDTVEDAIAEYGEALCSHCYPDAPVAKTLGKIATDPNGHPISRAQAQAALAAKAAEKAAKLAAKQAKQVFVPGTKDLILGPDNDEIKSEVTLNREIVDALSKRPEGRHWAASKHNHRTGETKIDPTYPTYGEWIEYAIDALAAKHGKDAAEIRAEMYKKLRARQARQGY